MPLISTLLKAGTQKDIREHIRRRAKIWKIAKKILGEEISKIKNIFKALRLKSPSPPLQEHLLDIYSNKDLTRRFPLYEFQEPLRSRVLNAIRALPFMDEYQKDYFDEYLLLYHFEGREEGIKRKAITLILPDAIAGKNFRERQRRFAKHKRSDRGNENVDDRNEIIRKAAKAIQKGCKRRAKSINEIAYELSVPPYSFISVKDEPLSQRQIRKIISQ